MENETGGLNPQNTRPCCLSQAAARTKRLSGPELELAKFLRMLPTPKEQKWDEAEENLPCHNYSYDDVAKTHRPQRWTCAMFQIKIISLWYFPQGVETKTSLC